MLPGMSDHQRTAFAEGNSANSYDDRGHTGEREAGPAFSSPPVLAFGCQNATALLVELRRRERRPSCGLPTCLAHGRSPASRLESDLDVAASLEALSCTTPVTGVDLDHDEVLRQLAEDKNVVVSGARRDLW